MNEEGEEGSALQWVTAKLWDRNFEEVRPVLTPDGLLWLLEFESSAMEEEKEGNLVCVKETGWLFTDWSFWSISTGLKSIFPEGDMVIRKEVPYHLRSPLSSATGVTSGVRP
jgi:hypothetical protein